MKRNSSAILPLFVFLLFLLACTRIDTTELGNELIPAVDNVTTFDTTLEVISDNLLLLDSLRTFSDDPLPVGEIFNDPEFGQTVSNIFFTVYPNPALGRPGYPFYNKDSIKGIDSVVLQLAYVGVYGDTNNIQTFNVSEISQASNFRDSSYVVGTGSFQTAGALGSKAVDFTKLNDSVLHIRAGDTTRLGNVLRIPLNIALGGRLTTYDTSNSANGGYRTDSIFRALFRGIALTVDSNNAGNRALAYFDLSNNKTSLQVYYRVQRNGVIDTTVAEFFHTGRDTLPGGAVVAKSGRAATIRRNPQNGYGTYLANGNPNDDRLYIQSTPGSYALLRIPGLSGLNNRVIHRAELIAPRIPTASENIFGLPNGLFLDMVTTARDSAYTVQNDFLYGQNGPNFAVFGGAVRKSDETYHFNISRHVQGIVTRNEPNYDLRLYAPYATSPWYLPPGRRSDYGPSTIERIPISVSQYLGFGRVVLHGGAAADPAKKLRLYIIYSKI